jgi:rubrerythrin
MNENAALRAKVEALEKENRNLKSKPTCVLSESGYMCSHCGTTLRQDNPDWSVIDGLQAQLAAMTQDVKQLNNVLRHAGWGQGEIDSAAYTFDKMAKANTALVAERDRLLKEVRKLDALEAMGVDNWEGYEDAIDDISEEKTDV